MLWFGLWARDPRHSNANGGIWCPLGAQLGGSGCRLTVSWNTTPLPLRRLENQQALIKAANFPITYGDVRDIKGASPRFRDNGVFMIRPAANITSWE